MLCFTVVIGNAQSDTSSGSLYAGARIQKAMGFYTFSGVTAEFSSKKILKQQLSFGANFTTSFLGSAFLNNGIKTYELDFSAIKYFRKEKKLQPITRLNIGYMYASYGNEFADVPNSAMTLSAEFDISYQINSKLRAVTGFGYNTLTGNGSKGLAMIYPLFGQISILYKIN